jgi:hypothetical protein
MKTFDCLRTVSIASCYRYTTPIFKYAPFIWVSITRRCTRFLFSSVTSIKVKMKALRTFDISSSSDPLISEAHPRITESATVTFRTSNLWAKFIQKIHVRSISAQDRRFGVPQLIFTGNIQICVAKTGIRSVRMWWTVLTQTKIV